MCGNLLLEINFMITGLPHSLEVKKNGQNMGGLRLLHSRS